MSSKEQPDFGREDTCNCLQGNPPVKLAGLYIVRTGAVMGGATR